MHHPDLLAELATITMSDMTIVRVLEDTPERMIVLLRTPAGREVHGYVPLNIGT